MRQPNPPRQTSTPVRRRPGGGRANLLILLALAVSLPLTALAGLALRSSGSDGGDSPPPSSAVSSEGEPARPGARAAATGPTPCAYCNQDPNRWRASTDRPPPEIGGESAALIEGSCGTLVYGTNETDRRPPASLTKIVAAMVTVERARLTDVVDIKIDGWDLSAEDDSTIVGLEAGMRLPVDDLLYGMLLASGNDAALALADHLGGRARFVDLMNAKVRQLGLTNTHFVTPDGRDSPDHYSTALDMAVLGRYLLQDPVLKKVVATRQYTPHWDRPVIWNNNAMLYYYEGAIGVKIGYTEQADYTIVAAAQREGRLLIVSVFGGWHLYLDSIRLLDWAFANTKNAC